MSVDWLEIVPWMLHDIRAQVRKTMTSAQFLERRLGKNADEEAMECLRSILASQSDLNNLSSRLALLADAERPSSGSTAAVPLTAALLGTRLQWEEVIHQAGGELIVDRGPACGVFEKIQVILKELMDNAVRFADTEQPLQVVIKAEQTDDSGVKVRVSDNGTGLDPMYIDRLFRPFQRFDARRSGFGLGLAISKAIIENAGGTIKVEPAQRGARFVLFLPVMQPAPYDGKVA